MLLVAEATSTGLLLGVTLMEVALKSSGWILPLVLGFGSAVGAVHTTLLAIHNCQAIPERQRAVATAH